MTLSRIASPALTILVLLGIFYLLRHEISIERLTILLAGQDVWDLLNSAILFAIAIAGTAARYRYVIRRVTGARTSFSYLLLLTNFSFACSYLAPISVVAEILRVGFTRHHLRVNTVNSVRLVLIDKLLGLVGVAMLALVLVPFTLAVAINRELIATEVVAIVAFLGALFMLGYAGSWLALRAPFMGTHARKIGADWRFILSHFVNMRDLGSLCLYTLVAVGGFGAGMVMVARAVGIDLSAGLILLMSPTVLLAQNAPMFYAGFGAREAIMLVALKNLVSLDPNSVLGFSVMVGVMLLVAATLPALIFLVYAFQWTARDHADHQGE